MGIAIKKFTTNIAGQTQARDNTLWGDQAHWHLQPWRTHWCRFWVNTTCLNKKQTNTKHQTTNNKQQTTNNQQPTNNKKQTNKQTKTNKQTNKMTNKQTNNDEVAHGEVCGEHSDQAQYWEVSIIDEHDDWWDDNLEHHEYNKFNDVMTMTTTMTMMMMMMVVVISMVMMVKSWSL